MTPPGPNASRNQPDQPQPDTASGAPGPLDGVRVVEFGQLIAGPGTTSWLGQLGAEVIKVESPAGDAARQSGRFGEAIFTAFNQRKRSVVADLDAADGRHLARSLCDSADVVVENFRHGSLAKRGLGYDELRATNPGLVYASASGFPSAGVDARRPAFDIVAQAESGMMSIVGEPAGPPLKIAFTVVDVATTYALTTGVLAALMQRDRTGHGSLVEVSLVDVATHLQSQVWVEYLTTGATPTRFGNGHPSAAPAGDLIEVADGYIVLSAYTEAHWRRLCEALGNPAWTTDLRFASNDSRAEHREALLEMLATALGSYDRHQAVSRFADAGVVAGAVFDYGEAYAASTAADNGTFEELPATGGSLTAPRSPVRHSGWENPPGRAAPDLGTDTEELRAELGLPTRGPDPHTDPNQSKEHS